MSRSYQFLISFAIWMSFSTYAHAFDCKKAYNATEKTICKNTALKSIDKRMSRSYYQILRKVEPKYKSNLIRNQKKWLAFRNECGGNASCLRGFYKDWMTEFHKFQKRQALHKRKKQKTKKSLRKKTLRKSKLTSKGAKTKLKRPKELLKKAS